MKNFRELAKRAIDKKLEICYDVALLNGQSFENVRHMPWFLTAVASQLEFDDFNSRISESKKRKKMKSDPLTSRKQ